MKKNTDNTEFTSEKPTKQSKKHTDTTTTDTDVTATTVNTTNETKKRSKDAVKEAVKELAIEDIYQKMEHKEHALTLPDTYVGSIEIHEEPMWIVDENFVSKFTKSDNNENNDNNSNASSTQHSSNTPAEEVPDDSSTTTTINTSNTSTTINTSVVEDDEDDKEDNKSLRMVMKKLKYVPGLYKIYDEVLVNAIDHWTRMNEKIRKQNMMKKGEIEETPEITLKMKFKPVKNIKVTIDQEKNEISVYNDGDGIPIELHKEFKVYVPELLFSQFLTSGNYKGKNGKELNQIKIIGGKNGYGAKLAALFSTRFTVETVDANNQKKYVQTFENNLNVINPPEITASTAAPYTKITFQPDLARFSLLNLTNDIVALFKKRVYDAAGWCNNVVVSFNDKVIPIKDFNQYVDLYLGSKMETKRVSIKIDDRWQICVCVSQDHDFQQVSMVNGIITSKGGRHVNYIADQIAKKLAEDISTEKDPILPKTVRSNTWLFLRCVIENPNFDSQTKENMTTQISQFGSKCDISIEDIKKIGKCGISQRAKDLSKFKETQTSKSTDGRKVTALYNIEKLDDAEYAGSKKYSSQCTLILTEGDSAKGFAQNGLIAFTPEERKYWGIFPLRGKMLNVRNAKQLSIDNNVEITYMKQILGLQSGVDYSGPNGIQKLRYGRVLILTDADHDGAHIKGLFINFLHKFWPSLLECNNFISTMITPIVIAWKERKTGRKVEKIKMEKFYSQNKFNEWKLKNNNGSGWKTRYYKGLGTSEDKDAAECFKERKIINFITDEPIESSSGKIIKPTDDAINLAFLEENTDQRKTWLLNADLDLINEYDITQETYSDFINHELIHFSWADTYRSIPNLLDGLKPGQRKIIYWCLKHNLKDSLKVAQLSGKIASETCYHHGEISLEGAIVGIAQNFVGSNNINLLFPSGNFGNKYTKGKNAASSRYIYTNLEDITPFIFKSDDNPLYKYLDDDGIQIEPQWFLPIIPMVLVNGANGIGTGFSTYIPQYNPTDIIQRLRQLLIGIGLPVNNPIPWYRGFTGTIIEDPKGGYICIGEYEISQNKIIVRELPVAADGSFEDYKKFLESVIQPPTDKSVKTKQNILTEMIKSLSFDTSLCRVEIIFHPGALHQLISRGVTNLEKILKLRCHIPTTNMTLFNAELEIKKYGSVNDIIKDYFVVRLDYYNRRKNYLIAKYNYELAKLSAKLRFVTEIINEELVIYKKSKKVIIELLESANYPKFANKSNFDVNQLSATKSPKESVTPIDTLNDNPDTTLTTTSTTTTSTTFITAMVTDDGEDENDVRENYNYLLSMRIDSFSQEMLNKLNNEKDIAMINLEWIMKNTPEELWLNELDKFETEYLDWLKCWYEEKNVVMPNDLKSTKKIKMNKVSRKSSINDLTTIDTTITDISNDTTTISNTDITL